MRQHGRVCPCTFVSHSVAKLVVVSQAWTVVHDRVLVRVAPSIHSAQYKGTSVRGTVVGAHRCRE